MEYIIDKKIIIKKENKFDLGYKIFSFIDDNKVITNKGKIKKNYLNSNEKKNDISNTPKTLVEILEMPIDKIIIISKKYEENIELIKSARKKNIEVSLIVDYESYSKDLYNQSISFNFDVYTSDSIEQSNIYIDLNSNWFGISKVRRNEYLMNSTYIEKIHIELDSLYKMLKLPNTVDYEEIKDKYYLDNCNMFKLNIRDECKVSRQIQTVNMDDFINERFDYSILEQTNQSVGFVKTTVYEIILIPPKLSDIEINKSIYSNCIKLLEEFREIRYEYNIEELCSALENLQINYETFSDAKNFYLDVYNKLMKMITNCDYKEYYIFLNNSIKQVEYYCNNIVDHFMTIFDNIWESIYERKINVFDEEILTKNELISKTKKSIEAGKEILKYINRIKSLEEELNQVKQLKKDAELEKSKIFEEEREKYIKSLEKKIENQEYEKDKTVFFGMSKTDKNEAFEIIENNIEKYARFFNMTKDILKKFFYENIPTNFIIYGNRIKELAISCYDELEEAKKIASEFGCKIVVRR